MGERLRERLRVLCDDRLTSAWELLRRASGHADWLLCRCPLASVPADW
jgi:hypothetical protein